jgi:hypothetical protein
MHPLWRPGTTGAQAMKAVNPTITITPNAAQYRRICKHLNILRAAGATSNTDAIEAALEQAAEVAYSCGGKKTAGHRSNGPRPTPGGKS